MSRIFNRLLWIVSFGLFSVLLGCKTPKVTIKKGQHLYAYDYRTLSSGQLTSYVTTAPFKATLKEDSDALYITTDEDNLTPGAGGNKKIDFIKVITPSPLGSLSPFSIPEGKAASEPDKKKFYFSIKEEDEKKFVYAQWKPYVQGIVIPIKFRLATGGVPPQVESGPTLALAPGFKRSWNTYHGTKNALGFSTNSISVSAGLILGLGVTDVNSKTTQNQVADINATKNAVIPLGFHFVAGYNNFNVGAALGWDAITGPNSSKWNYNGKPWVGLIVGFDIIK